MTIIQQPAQTVKDDCHICHEPFVPKESGQALCPGCLEAEEKDCQNWHEERIMAYEVCR